MEFALEFILLIGNLSVVFNPLSPYMFSLFCIEISSYDGHNNDSAPNS